MFIQARVVLKSMELFILLHSCVENILIFTVVDTYIKVLALVETPRLERLQVQAPVDEVGGGQEREPKESVCLYPYRRTIIKEV